ncbi:hypothetical protein C4U78_00980 [Clostridioides difficile]
MIKKIIAVTLVTLLSVTPILKSAYAAENGSSNVESSSTEIMPLDSLNFTSKDPNNENIGYIESDNYKGKVNIETGDITHTLYNEDGSVKESYTTNYYDNLENMGAEVSEKSPRITVVQNGAGKLYYEVNRTSRDYITIKNSNGNKKSYSKEKGKYYSGNTKSFMDTVDDASIPYKNMIATLITAGLVVSLVAYLGITTTVITGAMMKSALISIGFAGAAAVYVYMTDKYNSYRRSALSANHYYNAI